MHVPSSARTGVVAYSSASVGTTIFGAVRRNSTVLSPARMASANLGLSDRTTIRSGSSPGTSVVIASHPSRRTRAACSTTVSVEMGRIRLHSNSEDWAPRLRAFSETVRRVASS